MRMRLNLGGLRSLMLMHCSKSSPVSDFALGLKRSASSPARY